MPPFVNFLAFVFSNAHKTRDQFFIKKVKRKEVQECNVFHHGGTGTHIPLKLISLLTYFAPPDRVVIFELNVIDRPNNQFQDPLQI
jgi:hypothetical protein